MKTIATLSILALSTIFSTVVAGNIVGETDTTMPAPVEIADSTIYESSAVMAAPDSTIYESSAVVTVADSTIYESSETISISDSTEATLAAIVTLSSQPLTPSMAHLDTSADAFMSKLGKKATPPSIYSLPESWTLSAPNWHRMWINTAVLSGAFVATLFVLELLPEDATAWNRATLQQTPFYERWYKNVFVRGPEWDHDNPIFNYVLHPYAGAAYFMSARSCGFNYAQSLLYSACISTICWEYGIEACMERPSIQDLFITPGVGSLIGEGFYRIKRHIVQNGYCLLGSPVLGNVVAFLIDPVNEVVNLFRGSDTRGLYPRKHKGHEVSGVFMPTIGRGRFGFTLAATF
ncbi:MAG: DUF3943 domain-containing protein [Muribaculaceae bacterium]|nr:DUF3943 domain-containing protein [Muribaculaceae bacterium]